MRRELNSSLSQSWAIQRRIIFALVMREALTRYGRHNIGFLWLFVEPMIFTIGITIFWTFTKAAHGSDLPIVPFAITGYSSVLVWRNIPGRLSNAVLPNVGIMHHRNVRLIDIYFARLLLETSGVSMSFLFLTLAFWVVEWTALPEDVLQVLSGWLLLNWFGWSMGLLIGSLSEQTEIIEKIWHPATYFLFPLSGAAFIADALPPAFRDFVLWLPMVHCVEYIREGFFGSAFVAHYDLGYVVTCCCVMSVAGFLNVNYVANRVVLQ
ncbi:ABC transporter permease [Sphingobium fluviale]|uniref:ABC transporter permease n=1 Tax=Sphingobium fluviale TaxID=2506423 RepID=A0A4Q1KIG5_9SPHN|nr:ABC transporter permease [Sphingobium fluviale]